MNLSKEYQLCPTDIEALLKTKQDFLDGKTIARDWEDIEAELIRQYDEKNNFQS